MSRIIISECALISMCALRGSQKRVKSYGELSTDEYLALVSVSAELHTYLQSYIHTCRVTYILADLHTYLQSYIHTCRVIYILAELHTYMQSYTHTCRVIYILAELHTYMQSYILAELLIQ